MQQIALLLLLLLPWVGRAGIIASATRVVFQEGKKPEQSLMLVNTNPYPILVQTWVDNGENNPAPEKVQTPFVTLPPMFKLEPKEIRGLRIVYNGMPLPQNRESVYWLNLYEIPPARLPKVPYQAQIAMAMDTQMKIFYRPKGVQGTVIQAADQLSFTLQRQGENQQLICRNPSAFYLSFATLAVRVNGQNYPVELQNDMMTPPLSQRSYPLTTLPADKSPHEVAVVLIDEQGHQQTKQYSLRAVDMSLHHSEFVKEEAKKWGSRE